MNKIVKVSENHKVKPTSWRDVLAVHPAANLFPLMKDVDPEALRALAEDIKARDLQTEIVIWKSYAEAEPFEQLLDGRNRLDALELAGLLIIDDENADIWLRGSDGKRHPIPTTYVEARTCKSSPRALVASFNIHRRHLTPESKHDLIAKLLKATPEQSNRQIAETVKVDHKTVASVRAEMVATGEIPQLEKTVGKDGKARKSKSPKQPAHKPKSPAASPQATGNGVDPAASAEQRKAEAAASDKQPPQSPQPQTDAQHVAHQIGDQVDEIDAVCRKAVGFATRCLNKLEAQALLTPDDRARLAKIFEGRAKELVALARDLLGRNPVPPLDLVVADDETPDDALEEAASCLNN